MEEKCHYFRDIFPRLTRYCPVLSGADNSLRSINGHRRAPMRLGAGHMSRLSDIFMRVRSVKDTSVDLAMAAALPTADPLSARLIAMSLLDRGRDDALISLVLQYHRLEQDVQDIIVARCSNLDGALRRAAAYQDGRGPANVIRIIGRSRTPRLAYLVAEQIRHGPQPLREEAARCLFELAGWVATAAGPGRNTSLDARNCQFLQSAIEDLVCLYRHNPEPDLLHAMMALAPRRMAKSIQYLSAEQSDALPDLRRLLEQPDPVCVRRAMLMLVPVPTLTDAVHRGLRWLGSGNLGHVLENAHLLVSPPIAKALRTINKNELSPSTEQIESMTPAQSRGLPRWIMALPLLPRVKVEKLAALRVIEDAPTRLASLRELIRFPRLKPADNAADPHPAIARFCDDPDPSIARIATLELIRRRPADLPAILLRIVNAGHADVRAIAGRALAPMGFERLWQGWPKLTYEQRLAAGRALLKLDSGFLMQVGKKLDNPDDIIRLRTLAIIHMLNQGALFEQALLILATDPNRMIASAAVRALGSADSPNVRTALESALEHPDSRVRANAVEALEQLRSTRHVHRLVEMARQDDNRPRANAIKALMKMRTSDSMAFLTRMLADRRPNHRRSALWMVESIGVIEVARQVAEISVSDPDREVKSQAGEVVQHLIQILGSSSPTSDFLTRSKAANDIAIEPIPA